MFQIQIFYHGGTVMRQNYADLEAAKKEFESYVLSIPSLSLRLSPARVLLVELIPQIVKEWSEYARRG